MVFSSFGNISTVEPPLFPRAKELAKSCKVLFYIIILPLLGKRKYFFIPRTSFYRGSPSSFHLPCEQTPLDQGRLMVLYSQRYHIVTSDNAESPSENSIITLIFFVVQLDPIWTKFYKFCSPTHNNIIIIKQGK